MNVLTAVEGLWTTGAPGLAVCVGGFLVLAPLGTQLLALVHALRHRKAAGPQPIGPWQGVLHRWQMLDVFALALGVYLLEGSEFVHAEAEQGAILLVALVALHWPASEWARRVG